MAVKGRPNVAAFFWASPQPCSRREATLKQTGRLFLPMIVFAAIAVIASDSAAQALHTEAIAPRPPVLRASVQIQPDDSPVSDARSRQSWEYGPFVNGGFGLGNRDNFQFFSLGAEVGKVLTPVIHAGFFSGQFQLAANLMPFWQAYTPAPHEQAFLYPGGYFIAPDGGGTYTGASITPVILRWNFLTRSKRLQPWFQGAGGLIYTTHKFPPDELIPHGTPGGTSVFNFSPQGGGGIHYFIRPRKSLDLGVNAVHISSASLGDRNPGVNASIQIQFGYTFWK
jgi:lipid A 3-O-deacylase